MQIVRMSNVTPEFIKEHSDYLYLFGDNEDRRGLGGQARVMRPAPLSVGIRTKVKPSMALTAFWSDDNFEDNKKKIDADFAFLWEVWKANDKPPIVIPYGIGAGMSKLPELAPRTFKYLNSRINALVLSKLLIELKEL